MSNPTHRPGPDEPIPAWNITPKRLLLDLREPIQEQTLASDRSISQLRGLAKAYPSVTLAIISSEIQRAFHERIARDGLPRARGQDPSVRSQDIDSAVRTLRQRHLRVEGTLIEGRSLHAQAAERIPFRYYPLDVPARRSRALPPLLRDSSRASMRPTSRYPPPCPVEPRVYVAPNEYDAYPSGPMRESRRYEYR